MVISNKLKKKMILAAAFILLVLAMSSLIYLFMQSTRNYAKEVAKPLEEALIEMGAVKVCEGGDSGRGWDNKTPYYGATYNLKIDRDDSIEIVNRIAQNQGFKLQHASPTNRGPLNSVGDAHIDKWYFDVTSKNSTYSDLENGPIELTSSVAWEGEKNICNQEKTVPEGTTMIGFGVTLPDFKQQAPKPSYEINKD